MEKTINKKEDNILNDLNKNELFAMIKNNCRPKAKRKVLITGVFFLLLGISLLIAYWAFGMNQIAVPIVSAIVVIEGFTNLYNYWVNKRIVSFEDPIKMISWYNNKNDETQLVKNVFIILSLLLLGYLFYYVISTDINNTELGPIVILLIALAAKIILLFFDLSKKIVIDSTDIKQLQELVEKV